MRLSGISKLASGAVVAGFVLSIGFGLYSLRRIQDWRGALRPGFARKGFGFRYPAPSRIRYRSISGSVAGGKGAAILIRAPQASERVEKRLRYPARLLGCAADRRGSKISASQKAHEPAKRFWQLLETSFYPAVEKGDANAIDAAFRQLSSAYARTGPQSMKRFTSQTRATTHRRLRRRNSPEPSRALIVLSLVVHGLVFGSACGYAGFYSWAAPPAAQRDP